MKIITVLADSLPFGAFPSTNTEYGLDAFVDNEFHDPVAIIYRSTLNQAVTITPVGSEQNNPGDLVAGVIALSGGLPLTVGSTTTQKDAALLNQNDVWMPFQGLTLTTGATAPTAGTFSATAYLTRINQDHGKLADQGDGLLFEPPSADLSAILAALNELINLFKDGDFDPRILEFFRQQR